MIMFVVDGGENGQTQGEVVGLRGENGGDAGDSDDGVAPAPQDGQSEDENGEEDEALGGEDGGEEPPFYAVERQDHHFREEERRQSESAGVAGDAAHSGVGDQTPLAGAIAEEDDEETLYQRRKQLRHSWRGRRHGRRRRWRRQSRRIHDAALASVVYNVQVTKFRFVFLSLMPLLASRCSHSAM